MARARTQAVLGRSPVVTADDQADLADLLGDDKQPRAASAGSPSSSWTPKKRTVLPPVSPPRHKWEELERAKLITTTATAAAAASSSPSAGKGALPGSATALFHYISAYTSMLCYYYPNICTAVVLLVIYVVLMALVTLWLNPTEHYGGLDPQFAVQVQTTDDVQQLVQAAAAANRWCLQKGPRPEGAAAWGERDPLSSSSCTCEDPLIPLPRFDHKSWTQATRANQQQIQRYAQHEHGGYDVDVAFLGEDVMEEMDGRWMGVERSEQLTRLENMFVQNFDKGRHPQAPYQGIALGVAGDTAPNVLYRLQNGELPDDFHPLVWWVHVGSNDLARTQCSEELVVLGIVRVVQEILRRNKSARVVINSVLPMLVLRPGLYPLRQDYQDSLGAEGAAPAVIASEKPASRQRRQRRFLEINYSYLDHAKPENLKKDEAAAQAEEAQREKQYGRRERKRARAIRRRYRRRNPYMNNKARMKKFRPGTAFLRRNEVPLWTSIQAINRALQAYAQQQAARVSFFDAHDIFVHSQPGQRDRLNSDLISVNGHPTGQGFKVWEEAIVKRLHVEMARIQGEHPDWFEESGADGDDWSPVDDFDRFQGDDDDPTRDDQYDYYYDPGEGMGKGLDDGDDDGLNGF